MDVSEQKRSIRRRTIERILALDPSERARQELALQELLPQLPGFSGAATALLYVRAFPEEIDTGPLLALALAQGKRLALPRVDRRERRLRLHLINDPARDLRPGTLGIPEPTAGTPEIEPGEADWVLVPGLAFDRRGYRIGRGAGHYDRLLPLLRPEVPRWALLLAPQWYEALPTEPHDQPLDGAAGPDAILRFNRPSTRPSGDARRR